MNAPAELSSTRLFVDEDMDAARRMRLPRGEACVYSRRCPGRAVNQDASACVVLEEGGVLAVADGLGGQPKGGSASRIAVECLKRNVGRTGSEGSAVRAAILDGVEEANRRVLELGIGAGTTLAAVEIVLDTLRPYHVGDSEILVVGQRGLVKLQTVSHSPVGYAVEAGMLDGDEALHHGDRHLVSNLVGSSEMRIEVGSPLELAPRDTLLLATDGLCDNLPLHEIVDTIRAGPLERAAASLAEVASRRMDRPVEGQPSKPDDLTFILYRRSTSR
jgi:serine/threonine protein phosphatase PrpC